MIVLRALRYLKRGRVRHWGRDKGVVAIENPGTQRGVVFTPKNGKQYFDDEAE